MEFWVGLKWLTAAITLGAAGDLIGRALDYMNTQWDSLETVVQVVVTLLFCIYFSYQMWESCLRSQANRNKDLSGLPVLKLVELHAFNGRTEPEVYCSVQGRIYDVSTSSSITPGGGYEFLCGADATLGVARMSYDRKLVNSIEFDDLSEEEWSSVRGWVSYMDSKYDVVARLLEYEVWTMTRGLPFPGNYQGGYDGPPALLPPVTQSMFEEPTEAIPSAPLRTNLLGRPPPPAQPAPPVPPRRRKR